MAIADNTMHLPAAERRVRARRQHAAVDGVVIAASAATLIIGGGWLALIGPMLIAAWHTCGSSRTYHPGQHRRSADAPRHTGGRLQHP